MDSIVTIREMRIEDAGAVSRLTTELGYIRNAEDIAAWLAHQQANQSAQTAFVACVGGQVVGWVEVSIERRLQSAPFGMIGGLVVSDSMRGRGIGRKLCAQAEQWTWERGFETLRVTSRSTRADAHRFYLRDGYRQVKTSLVFEKQQPPKANRP